MKNAVNERLTSFIEYLGTKKVDFASIIGETKYSVNNWLSDTKIPVASLSNILLAYPELDARWLLTGEGRMLSGELNYKENDRLHSVEEPEYKNCKMCVEKDRLIGLLERTEADLRKDKEDLRRQIEFLEFSMGKSLKNGSK